MYSGPMESLVGKYSASVGLPTPPFPMLTCWTTWNTVTDFKDQFYAPKQCKANL